MLLYVIGSGALLAFLGLDIMKLGYGDAAVRWWSERWVRRVDHGEAILASGRTEEAAAYLADLDREFPAQHAKHARDRDRERLLRALATAYETLGRDRLARETLQTLAAFDPRNYLNHYDLARLLLRQRRTDEAEPALAAALAIHPSHRASFEELVAILSDAGRQDEVIQRFETYLGAVSFADVTAALGEVTTQAAVPIDGLAHDRRIPLPPGDGARELVLHANAEHAVIEKAILRPLLHAGRARRLEATVHRPEHPTATLSVPVPEGGSARVDVRVRIPRPISSECLDLVETAYRSTLRIDELNELRPRLQVEEAR